VQYNSTTITTTLTSCLIVVILLSKLSRNVLSPSLLQTLMRQSRQIRQELTRLDRRKTHGSATTLAVFGPNDGGDGDTEKVLAEVEKYGNLSREELMLEELAKLLRLNEELCAAETKEHILGSNLKLLVQEREKT